MPWNLCLKNLVKKTIVFIFDECHRSQFGLMHHNITKNFKNNYLFGFTGTPIFSTNARSNITSISNLATKEQATKDDFKLKTTNHLFKTCLSTYNMINSINDQNTLPFKFDDIQTIQSKSQIKDEQVLDINRKEVWEADQRISKNAKTILATYDQKTMRYVNGSNDPGFNAILTCSSINSAKKYYRYLNQFNEQKLKIAMIYSQTNHDEQLIQNQNLAQEDLEHVGNLNPSDQAALAFAINQYNQTFRTNFNLKEQQKDQSFQSYYQDVAKRMKNREIDLLIVVNMFLTGFDAPCVNTLWIDRNLEYHGLIQAISRTNRIANPTKNHGNVISFRPNKENLKIALSLYYENIADAWEIIVLKKFNEYYEDGYYDANNQYVMPYVKLVANLKTTYSLQIISEQLSIEEKSAFINLFTKILKLRNILLTFDEFMDQDSLTIRERQNYLSYYLSFNDQIKQKFTRGKVASIVNDVEFINELVISYDIGSSNLFNQIKTLHNSGFNAIHIIEEINQVLKSSVSLRSKKALIEEFIKGIVGGLIVVDAQGNYEALFYDQLLLPQRENAIKEIATTLKLDQNQLKSFLNRFWNQNYFDEYNLQFQAFLNANNGGFFNNHQNWNPNYQNQIDLIKSCYDQFSF